MMGDILCVIFMLDLWSLSRGAIRFLTSWSLLPDSSIDARLVEVKRLGWTGIGNDVPFFTLSVIFW